ncbi:TAP-like protein-domain-containing protein [Xylariaceae sp. FL1272]|nr:TAP-like protein-domain-containing protein [Xylariaceae sp. FL1272]
MTKLNLSAALALAAASQASCLQNCTWDSIVPSKSLSWCSCLDGFFCAKLDVPLDYKNVDLGRASVPLIKLPQGMILTNPGGLGGSSIDEVQANGVEFYQSITGDNWDMIGFEPRGIYRSEPNINNCSTSQLTRNATLKTRFVPEQTDDFFTSYIEAGLSIGEACQTSVGGENDAAQHMSTTTNARDMLSIVEAFTATQDGARAARPSNLLNYFGYSYGTFLGQVFASLFPAKVGHMVLDGVLSGPLGCSFYTGSSASDIYGRFNASFVQLDAQRAKAEGWANATAIEDALLTLTALYYATSAPLSLFPSLGDALVSLEQSIASQSLELWTQGITALIDDPIPAGDVKPELVLGILCADQESKWYNMTLDDLTPLIEHLEKSMLRCLGCSIEVYAGPFGGDTAIPILFVGNTYDPIAPVTSALEAAPKYKNAKVVTVDAFGHTSRVNAYFRKTQMPGDDAYCASEITVLGNGTIEEVIDRAGLSQLVQ